MEAAAENQKEYWNGAADTKEFTTPFQIELFEKHVGKNAKILDVGCGYGRTLSQLGENGYKNLCGIDFSEKMIERGKKLNPKLDLSVMAGKNIPFDEKSFDCVILFAVLTCIIDNAEQEYLLSEIKRVLKPGGILYINDFLLNEDRRNLDRYDKFKEKYGQYGVFELPEGAVLRHQSPERVKELTAGFETLEQEKVVYTTMNGHKSNGFYFLGRLLEK